MLSPKRVVAQILSPARVSMISPWACVGLVQAAAGRGLVVGAGEDEPGGLDARVCRVCLRR